MATKLGVDTELCPDCGLEPRWVESTPDTDYWACPCGTEFEITIGNVS